MKDVLGEALTDHYHQRSPGKLWVNNKYGPKEEMPVDVYFREAEDMPELEWIALQQCKGRVLDIGAGAGSHALTLQRMGFDVTALDISRKAAAVMRSRGVKKIILQDFFTLESEELDIAVPDLLGAVAPAGYDTLLLLMNGIGLSGTLDGLRTFLAKARTLLRPAGRLVFDSSDIAYLYEGKVPRGKDYYGEILYQYEYKKEQGDWFKWLFIDRKTLAGILSTEGWRMEVLFEDEWGQFLVSCQLQ